jgi:transcriptional/translational regulatory protein YebC/TACO1
VIYTDPADFSAVREHLENAGCVFLSAERAMIPTNVVDVADAETAAKVERLIERLEDFDDTQNIYHNANLPEDESEE